MASCCRLSELAFLSSFLAARSRFYVALPPSISRTFSYFRCHSISGQPLPIRTFPRSSCIGRVHGFRSPSEVVSNGSVGSEPTSTQESADQTKADASTSEGGSRRRSGRGADGRKAEGTSSREEIRSIRLKKLEGLRDEGYVPYAYSWKKTHSSLELQKKYGELGNGEEAEEEQDNVSVAGRIMARRAFGKLAFLTLRDDSGSIQLFCEKERMPNDTFDLLKNMLDIGDFVGATGTIKRTEKGELSVKAKNITILTKSLLPLPDKWHGLTDVETRYRQRYLDMIMNSDVANIFRVRAKVTSEIRRHMEELGYIEIETPILQGAAGGAEARPFVTYHNSLQRDLFLRIATELHLKRMMVGGFEKVFEIGRIFRNEGISTRHNPEFTSIEMYQAYADYNDMMELAEDIITRCAMAIHGQLKLQYQGIEIVLEKPWRRATMKELVEETTGIDFSKYSDLNEAKRAALTALSTSQERHDASSIVSLSSFGQLLNVIFELLVEKTLIQPTIVTDYPVEISPLSKPHRSFAGFVERFELFICGRELANAFSELTDALEQRARFQSQIELHNARLLSALEEVQKNDDPDLMEKSDAYEVKLDEDFLTALEYGMPPTAGMGIGIDRLVMLMTDSASIRDVIAFPVLKTQ